MSDETKRTPQEWINDTKYEGIEILDPNGWDRQNFKTSWNEPINQQTFEHRLAMCKLTISATATWRGP